MKYYSRFLDLTVGIVFSMCGWPSQSRKPSILTCVVVLSRLDSSCDLLCVVKTMVTLGIVEFCYFVISWLSYKLCESHNSVSRWRKNPVYVVCFVCWPLGLLRPLSDFSVQADWTDEVTSSERTWPMGVTGVGHKAIVTEGLVAALRWLEPPGRHGPPWDFDFCSCTCGLYSETVS